MLRSYAAIIVWGILLFIIGIPVLLIGLVYPAKSVLALGARWWGRTLLWVCGVKLTVEGRHRIPDGIPHFFVGNHQSALDIPILFVALRGHVRFMAKEVLFKFPIFGWILSRYGFVPVDRGRARRAAIILHGMIEELQRNPISFVVFPEGTRTPDGSLQTFRLGAFNVCIRAGMSVVPFTIDGAWAVCPPRSLRIRPGPVRLVFGTPVPSEVVLAMTPSQLQDRVKGEVAAHLGRNNPRSDGAGVGPNAEGA
ncbi:MAG: lysophospholipid acyltransferase family protein [Planctomycetota bacterium]